MKKMKKSLTEKLIYNDKILIVISVLLSITLWATVKINYSNETSRVISDVKITLNAEGENEEGYKYFVDEAQLYADVEIAGKSYNINSNVISKDDIVVTVSDSFADTAGKKWLTLSAKLVNGKGGNSAQIVSVTPSTIAVYYDREITDTFNVEAQLSNSAEDLVDEGYIAGAPVPSVKTVDITGPESILNQLEKVFLQAEIPSEDLPLTKTKTMTATVRYQFGSTVDLQYISCPEFEKNVPTVTVSVKERREIPTAVKYINQPEAYTPSDGNVTINPEKVNVISNTNSTETKYIIETIDFRELSNKVNKFVYTAEETQSSDKLADDISLFTVTIDFSDMSRKVVAGNSSNVLFVNSKEDFDYNVDFSGGGLDSIILIGPSSALSQITYEDIQIEINVDSLDLARSGSQQIEVSNISIQNEAGKECWVYGSYTATVTAVPKAE